MVVDDRVVVPVCVVQAVIGKLRVIAFVRVLAIVVYRVKLEYLVAFVSSEFTGVVL